MSGYTLHSEAFNDIDEIRAYIAEDDPDAADRVITAIFERIRSPHQEIFRWGNGTTTPSLRRYITERYTSRNCEASGLSTSELNASRAAQQAPQRTFVLLGLRPVAFRGVTSVGCEHVLHLYANCARSAK